MTAVTCWHVRNRHGRGGRFGQATARAQRKRYAWINSYVRHGVIEEEYVYVESEAVELPYKAQAGLCLWSHFCRWAFRSMHSNSRAEP